MKIKDFKLEVYFGKYEITAPYLLTQSDCEAMKVSDLLEYEPEAEKKLLDSWLGYTEVAGSPKLRKFIHYDKRRRDPYACGSSGSYF